MGLSAGWIESRTGVRERRVAAAGETLADLAAAAADRALAAAAVSPREVDLVLVATLTADQRMPNAAPVVAEMIGARGAGAIDVGAACTGFVSALATAAAAVESGRSDSVLVVGAEVLSRVTDYDDRRTGGLFGDGAGAVLVGPAEGDDAIGPVRVRFRRIRSRADRARSGRRHLDPDERPRHLPACRRSAQRSNAGRPPVGRS